MSTNMSSSSDPYDDGVHDNVVRPRPRKPVHSQLSHITNLSETTNSYLDAPEGSQSTGVTR